MPQTASNRARSRDLELTREEREKVKARIGEMLTGEPITDAELENLDRPDLIIIRALPDWTICIKRADFAYHPSRDEARPLDRCATPATRE